MQIRSYVALHGAEYIAMGTAHQDEPDRLRLGWRGRFFPFQAAPCWLTFQRLSIKSL
jgi:hypothetical protein